MFALYQTQTPNKQINAVAMGSGGAHYMGRQTRQSTESDTHMQRPRRDECARVCVHRW